LVGDLEGDSLIARVLDGDLVNPVEVPRVVEEEETLQRFTSVHQAGKEGEDERARFE
jgi:hypothetical protein